MTRLNASLTATAVAFALFAAQAVEPASAQSFVRNAATPASALRAPSAYASGALAPVRAPDGGLIMPVPAPATIVRDPALDDVAAQAAALQPGESKWLPGAPRDGMVLVVVDLSAQRATVYRGGRPAAITTVSTGSAGRETPTGTYPILAKETMHHSNLYNDAPMPFMQRLTWHGVALHAGKIPGYPASHGCVRLPKAFAQQLFGVTARGNLVVIAEDGSADSLMRAGLQPWMALQVGRLSGDAAPTMLASEGGVSSNSALGAP
jgi:lipoprotein-anchoring transpeptidase ErfK/SrfK